MSVEKGLRANKKARIYTVFSSSGLSGSSVNFPTYHPDQKILTNEEILGKLENRCEGVEFVGETVPLTREKAQYAVSNIRNQQESLDGVLFFGTPPDELISIGLPTVAVHPCWGQWEYPFNPLKGKKVLTSFLPVIPDRDETVFPSRLEDIAGKIGRIQAISKMKGLRVLVVTDRPVLGAFEPTSLQTGPNRKEYERVYLDNLRETFETEFLNISQEEMVERMKGIGEEAEKVAEKWIDEAEGIKGTNKDEIVKSAKLYLAMKGLMEKYSCDAISTEGYGVFTNYKDGIILSQGLPSSQFCTDGIVATSETLMDSLITQQLGLYITGSTGFNGDYIIDPPIDTAIVGHCECPFNPYGDERRVPYVIRNRPQVELNVGGACVQANLPIGETVTVAKISMHEKKISVFTGETVSGDELFPHWDDILCRTKLAIKTDAKVLFENVDWKTFGNHRVAFYGDYRQEFKDLAKLIGFEVVEKDR
ncbi:MAG: hypothetical protein KAV99_01805 [Candidatus Latescibacteria bacterium]|nr:hypothetical protein [Candidatus Latescibacterota bacterium]